MDFPAKSKNIIENSYLREAENSNFIKKPKLNTLLIHREATYPING
jgi:hypothetical protein